MGGFLNPRRKAVQLHFGGGTPTFLLPEEIRALGRLIQSRFEFSPDIEAGVEVDARWLERDHIDALRDAGFNRASMGVQDNDPVVQKAIHRLQPFEQTAKVVNWIRDAGFKSINIDLIYGLPHHLRNAVTEDSLRGASDRHYPALLIDRDDGVTRRLLNDLVAVF